MRFAILAIVLLADPAPAQPPAVVVAPDPQPAKWVELKGKPGKPITLTADKSSRWRACSDCCTLIPFPDGKGAVFGAEKPGDYKVFVFAGDSDPTGVLVKVADPAPAPPAPNPPPPVPPTPPPPGPPTPPPAPPPTDPLAAKLKAAYDADPAAPSAKGEAKKDLAYLYREAVLIAGRKAIATGEQLVKKVRDAGDQLTPDQLVGLRKVVSEELGKVLPAQPTDPLTDAHRKAAADLFAKLAAALESF